MAARAGQVRICVRFVPKTAGGQAFTHCFWTVVSGDIASIKRTALAYLRRQAGKSYGRGKTISGNKADYDIEILPSLGLAE
jgi:hypothetical protein